MLEHTVLMESGREEGSQEDLFVKEVLKDFWICCISREASLLARKDVLTGKGKFGITGDGKEVPQVAMARAFKNGDFRSGYYRDQTLLFALGLCTVEAFFAQLYADAKRDPFSGGRQMNNHFASPFIDEKGNWTNHTETYNISSGISSTAGQMARALGLAFASKVYRNNDTIEGAEQFSNNGNEVCFCTIGDASTSEGVFWESMNAAAVLQVPLAIAVWDDGYGISVPKKYQTVKESISEALSGFQSDEEGRGIRIHKVKGWDYPSLCESFEIGIEAIRNTHTPALFHVEELTQPQGHSTSGSHERYKSKERLEWEKEHDCIKVMGQWMVNSGIASEEKINDIRNEAKAYVKKCRDKAWLDYIGDVTPEKNKLKDVYNLLGEKERSIASVNEVLKEFNNLLNPLFYEVVSNARKMTFALSGMESQALNPLRDWINHSETKANEYYHTKLYSNSDKSALRVPVVPIEYEENPDLIPGHHILNRFFDSVLEKNDAFLAFGEDVGQIGGVNQGFAGLQNKYGEHRVFDVGIREWTIIGQAIGMAMRGLRPMAEIQYLDYLVYGLVPLTDDLATLRYRSNGLQQAPAIVRTRGHRLEGIWHAGSPIGLLLNSLRGMYVVVPRDMTRAAGFYNTLLQSDDPALVIECLNGYRLREHLPANLGTYSLPLGVPEVLKEGEDVTLVTYGSCVRVAQKGIDMLETKGISVELIDVQTLLPFDLEHRIVDSLKKTNRIVFMDEDVPGGATAFMLHEVLEKQNGYQYLDAKPQTLTAKAHRPPYGSDGDYFSKPNSEDVFEVVYNIMRESDPDSFPPL